MASHIPTIVINFKSYQESMGQNAIQLAKDAETVSNETGVNIIVTPSLFDIVNTAKTVGIPVYSQHIDPISYGAYTGHVSPNHLKSAGIKGTLVNHSEKKLPEEIIIKTINVLRELDLDHILCVATPDEADTLIKNVIPNSIAIEPPELIGTGRAISQEKPEVIIKAIEVVSHFNIPLLCGAGVVDGKDVKKAIELGANGILVASGIVKAKIPIDIIRDFASNM